MFVCLIWGAALTIASCCYCCCCGTPAMTTTGCCFSSQDFSLCLTRRCKKELQGPVEGMLFLLGQLWIMFDVCLIWGSSTPETTLTVCCISSQDFSIRLTQRCQKEGCYCPGTIMFDVCLVWGSSTPETTLTVYCLSSQDFSICLNGRCQKELQGPVVGMLLSQDNYVWCSFVLGFRCKKHDRYQKLLKLWKLQHSWVKLN